MHAEISFIGLFWQASLLVKLVMMTLMGMSVVSWALIIQRSKAIKAANLASEQFEDRFWSGSTSIVSTRSPPPVVTTSKAWKTSSTPASRGVCPPAQGRCPRSGCGDGRYLSRHAVSLSRAVDDPSPTCRSWRPSAPSALYIGLFGTVWGS